MAPEYARNGNFSTKSDVYSFGVLVLEIISGKKISRPEAEESLVSHVSYVSLTPQLEKGNQKC